MKNILLTLVTENQTHKSKAEQLAKLLQTELAEEWHIVSIDKYDKFENAYKIQLTCIPKQKDNSEINNWAIRMTDKLVSPWLTYFDQSENTVELIFNKNETTRNRKEEFNVISWGHLQIIT